MSGLRYPVNDCYVCVQGEGVQTGMAMVLLRLHGCGVGCPWCDTKETWNFLPEQEVATLPQALGANDRFTFMTAVEIIAYIRHACPGPKWVLVSGGEPALYDLQPLVLACQAAGYKTAVETSGTELGHVGAGFDWVCVSPKMGMPGGKEVRLEALSVADEIKQVVGKPKDIEQLDALLAQATLKPTVQICLQPVSQSQAATQLCLDVVQKRGWRLSVQMHKYIGVQ